MLLTCCDCSNWWCWYVSSAFCHGGTNKLDRRGRGEWRDERRLLFQQPSNCPSEDSSHVQIPAHTHAETHGETNGALLFIKINLPFTRSAHLQHVVLFLAVSSCFPFTSLSTFISFNSPLDGLSKKLLLNSDRAFSLIEPDVAMAAKMCADWQKQQEKIKSKPPSSST